MNDLYMQQIQSVNDKVYNAVHAGLFYSSHIIALNNTISYRQGQQCFQSSLHLVILDIFYFIFHDTVPPY